MLDFETLYQKRGELFIFDLLEKWERYSKVSHPALISLEERWNYFLRVTEQGSNLAHVA